MSSAARQGSARSAARRFGFLPSSVLRLPSPAHGIRPERRRHGSRSISQPDILLTIADWGETAFATSPVEFGTFIAAENEKWGKVIRAANIKL